MPWVMSAKRESDIEDQWRSASTCAETVSVGQNGRPNGKSDGGGPGVVEQNRAEILSSTWMRKSRQVSRAAQALGLFKETPYLSLLFSSGISIGLVCCTTSLFQFHQEQGTYAAVGLKQFLHNL
jgi:hypothetical protein